MYITIKYQRECNNNLIDSSNRKNEIINNESSKSGIINNVKEKNSELTLMNNDLTKNKIFNKRVDGKT